MTKILYWNSNTFSGARLDSSLQKRFTFSYFLLFCWGNTKTHSFWVEAISEIAIVDIHKNCTVMISFWMAKLWSSTRNLKWKILLLATWINPCSMKDFTLSVSSRTISSRLLIRMFKLEIFLIAAQTIPKFFLLSYSDLLIKKVQLMFPRSWYTVPPPLERTQTVGLSIKEVLSRFTNLFLLARLIDAFLK